ncbi:hypothetical protein [Devosia sediminis]|uniref:Uncharacterized protein n=1 Tax=Devosia sediminis TaxID=2798801 RepID=A0A934IRE5_9HYPH|nr:hypothetical protein [Devosia sediminis]MBJ3785424.1 hypothetical protein [Devosia sediminis]
MQLSSAVFSNPAMRPQLEQFYEHQKEKALESLRARGDQTPSEVDIALPNGETRTATPIPFTVDKMEKAFVSFDDWMRLQERLHASSERHLGAAKQGLDRLAEHHPDSSAQVRASFSSGEQLLAYINADGTLVTHSGADFLQSIAQKANDLGLGGEKRVEYLTREIEKALTERNREAPDVTTYADGSSPTKREFAEMWYAHFDVDQHYRDALKQAQASYDAALEWHQKRQDQLNAMQAFFMSLQEST